MAAQGDQRVMVSERVAPGMLPRRLWLGLLYGVSAFAAIAIYGVSELLHRRHPRPSTMIPA